MPKDKSKMHLQIMEAAKEEFLNKGYEAASMRIIAAQAGITVSGIYKHFKNKEDLFSSLVNPTIIELQELTKQYEREDYSYLENDDINGMWDAQYDMNVIIDYVYDHYVEFKLLCCCSKGSSFSGFIEEIATEEERMTIAFMKEMQKKGMHVKFLPPKEMHILTVQFITAMFEVIVQDLSKEEATHYIETLGNAGVAGMRKVLEF